MARLPRTNDARERLWNQPLLLLCANDPSRTSEHVSRPTFIRRTGRRDSKVDFSLPSLLKDCARKKDLPRGIRIHADVVARLGTLERSPHLASALISMYVKCGAISKAHEVLKGLQVRNVICWNALIAGYAQQAGQFEEALNCLEEMQNEGLTPNAITYICILKACGSNRAIDKGKEIHQEIIRIGLLEQNIMLGTAVVDMYAKCGMLSNARNVLEELPERNVVSWNVLIAGCLRQGQCHGAFDCFDQMQNEGLLPDAVTFTCILTACGIGGAVEKGKQIHDRILGCNLLQKDAMLGNALLDMYARCGALMTAQKLLEELPVRDVISWNSLLARYTLHGEGQEALNCYEQMQNEGVSPDAVTLVSTLKACGIMGDIDKGRKIHENIVKLGLLEKDVSLGNALVDMYAKCGIFTRALQVQGKLPFRDAVSWNALIAGYAQEGRGYEALNCFGQMQNEGVTPDAVTFICALKACGNTKALEKGKQIHEEIVRKGLLETNVVLGTSLVDMYVQCGLLEKAQEILIQLTVRDVVSWSSLIAGYAQRGKGYEVLCCFTCMQNEGLSPDAVTFISILKACGSTRAIDKGRQIHADLISMGLLEKDIVLGTALVDMYAKCGMLAKAQEVLEALHVRDSVAWNALITGYVQQGQGHDALSCFDRMQNEGLSPHAVTYTCMLKACAITGAIDKGKEIHKEIMSKGLLCKDVVLGTALVDMYAKCSMLARAQEVLDELTCRNVASWNALITGYSQQGQGHAALNCLEQMQIEGISPNVITFVCVLKACSSTWAIGKGEHIHEMIVKSGLLETNIVLGNALVDMYAKCGHLGKAEELLKELPVRSVVVWNALISGYSDHGQGYEALKAFDQMQNEGLLPDDVTYICALKACGSIGVIEKGKHIHNQIVSRGLLKTDVEKDIVLGTALMDMYAKCAVFSRAQELLEELPVRNIVSWSALIAGYAQHGQGHEALHCFKRMLSEGLSPNAVTFICILKACANMGAIDKGEHIHNEILCRDLLKKDTVLGNALVDMYAKCGNLVKAQQVLEELPIQSIISWNALIAGCAQQGRGSDALNFLERMQREGFSPDDVTILCVLSACSHSGLLEDARTVFEDMTKKFHITPNVEHHTCMVMISACSGQFDVAMQVIEAMPSSDYSEVWLALLSACKKWGNLELGKLAFNQAVQLDDSCAVAYVLMVDIFAAYGMQKDAEKVESMRLIYATCNNPRSKMWVDASGNVCSYYVGDMDDSCNTIAWVSKDISDDDNVDALYWRNNTLVMEN